LRQVLTHSATLDGSFEHQRKRIWHSACGGHRKTACSKQAPEAEASKQASLLLLLPLPVLRAAALSLFHSLLEQVTSDPASA
jgi:hypothetical protein